ncbi:hypothetical protein BC628DRAFT_388008 [Trametes gibbosa]|nr:hypothetical protein BC628DRAFT_388008 [Trametes gibbosa]
MFVYPYHACFLGSPSYPSLHAAYTYLNSPPRTPHSTVLYPSYIHPPIVSLLASSWV